ncbi:MAG: M20/M25/M40 family metallo-hydrolase [candidate division WOR-3 bacterium]
MRKFFIISLLIVSGFSFSQEFLVRIPFSYVKQVKESPVIPTAFFDNSIIGIISADKINLLNFPYSPLSSFPLKKGELYIVYPSSYLEKSDAREIIRRYGEILLEERSAFLVNIDEEKANFLSSLGFEIAHVSMMPVVIPEEYEMSVYFPKNYGKENPIIRQIIDRITPSEIAQFIRELSGEVPVIIRGREDTIKTRYTYSPKNSSALFYLYERFQEFNLDSINFHPFRSESNIVATKRGLVYPHKYWIIGGHMDCVSEQSSVYAPGADDNASGTVAALIAAKYLSRYPFKYSIKFIGWNAEEQGLYGSAAHAESIRQRRDSLLGVINGDMIATEMTNRDSVTVYNGNRIGSIAMGDTFIVCNQRYNIGLRIGRSNTAPANSDHYSYYSRGFEAIMVHEGNFSPNYHSTRDRITAPEFDTLFLTQVIKCMVATLATLAQPIPSGAMYQRHIIIDTPPLGNGDGILNPGESCEMPIWIKSFSNYPLEGVKGIIRHTRPDTNVVFYDSVKYFGTILPNDSAFTGEDGFNLVVSPACTNGYVLPIELVIVDTLESTWVSPLNIKIGAPILSPMGIIVWDSTPGGNNNRKLDPGETAYIAIGIKNIGLGNGYNVYAILKSADPRFIILDSFGSYDTILKDSIKYNTFDKYKVYTDASVPREYPVSCTLIIHSQSWEFVKPFEIIVGEMGFVTDPIPDGPRRPPRYWAYDNVDTFYIECPEFEWIEIRNVGVQLPITQDDQTIQINLPFPFRYYGTLYTGQLSVCGNGWITPVYTTSTVYTNQPLPDPTSTNPSAMICVNWDDLYPPTGNGIWFYYDTLNHRMILEWDSVHYYNPRASWDKFQIIIYDTTVRTYTGDNEIVFQYLTANNYISNTVGIEDQTNTIGINALYNNTYHRACAPIVAGRAVKFTTDTIGYIGVKEYISLVKKINPKTIPTIQKGKFLLNPKDNLKLTIYEITGKKIFEGKIEKNWQRKLPNGIYYIIITQENEKIKKKIIYIK